MPLRDKEYHVLYVGLYTVNYIYIEAAHSFKGGIILNTNTSA